MFVSPYAAQSVNIALIGTLIPVLFRAVHKVSDVRSAVRRTVGIQHMCQCIYYHYKLRPLHCGR